MSERLKKSSGRVSLLLKTAAMLLISAGFGFGGFSLASYYAKRISVIREILLMISVIETQLNYACLPVSDILNLLCESKRYENLGFLLKCRSETENGEPFPNAWKKSVQSEKELCRLLSDFTVHLERLGADIGSTDVSGQLRCCEYYRRIFESELALREETGKKYSKLFPALGLTLGISAAILMI